MHSSELTTEMLLVGYSQGYFPMVVDEDTNETHWLMPNQRCLMPIDGIHVSRSLAKTIRQERFEISFDTSFRQVMESCRRPEGNWINDDFIRVYSQAADEGWGHCSECWIGENLVGGVYGIALGGAFFAESMFHTETDASKVALWALVETCRAAGFVLFDAQFLTPHLESLGGYEVQSEDYVRLLDGAIRVKTQWPA